MTKLLVDLRAEETWQGADGFVAEAASISPEAARGAELALLRGSPGDNPEWAGFSAAMWVVDQGLDAAAKLREYFPDARFLPHVQVYKPSACYSLADPYLGEGFRVYAPDTAAFRTWRVDDGDEALGDWLVKAVRLGFDAVWLESPEAAEAKRGYDLDLLERARKYFSGRIVLSGGVCELRHLACLREEGGCFAAVLPAAVAAACGHAEAIAQKRPPAGRPLDQDEAVA